MNRIRGAEQLDRFYPAGGGKMTDPGITADTTGEIRKKRNQKFQIIDQQPDFFPVQILCDRFTKLKFSLAAGNLYRFAMINADFGNSIEFFRMPHFCFPSRTRNQQDQSFHIRQIKFRSYFFLIIERSRQSEKRH